MHPENERVVPLGRANRLRQRLGREHGVGQGRCLGHTRRPRSGQLLRGLNVRILPQCDDQVIAQRGRRGRLTRFRGCRRSGPCCCRPWLFAPPIRPAKGRSIAGRLLAVSVQSVVNLYRCFTVQGTSPREKDADQQDHRKRGTRTGNQRRHRGPEVPLTVYHCMRGLRRIFQAILRLWISVFYATRGRPHRYASPGFRSRSKRALTATMTVDSDMTSAPTAGGRMMPTGARTPAARGIVTAL